MKQWVQLFSDGIVDGKLPEASSWLGIMWDSDNQKLMADSLEEFKVIFLFVTVMYFEVLLCRQLTCPRTVVHPYRN